MDRAVEISEPAGDLGPAIRHSCDCVPRFLDSDGDSDQIPTDLQSVDLAHWSTFLDLRLSDLPVLSRVMQRWKLALIGLSCRSTPMT